MKLSKGRMKAPLKVVIYGPEGIGKSTFASKFPVPIFIDTEGSTRHMDVIRVDPSPASFTELLEMVRTLASKQYADGYKTLVIDTADWAEKMCVESLCEAKQWKGIEDAGYGKGYTYLAEEFGKLLNLLEDVVRSGHNVVVTAHAMLRKFEQPDEMGAYDRWELKLQKKNAPLLKEWADMVLFANYKTMVVNVDGKGADKGKNKVQGGMRVMYTSHHPVWDAKNRFGLPEELPFDYKAIAHVVPEMEAPVNPVPQEVPSAAAETSSASQCSAPSPGGKVQEPPQQANNGIDEEVPTQLRQLMEHAGITAKEIRQIVAQVGYFPEDTPIMNYGMDFINGMLVADWKTVEQMIIAGRAPTPF